MIKSELPQIERTIELLETKLDISALMILQKPCRAAGLTIF